jgi:hypothetical protein
MMNCWLSITLATADMTSPWIEANWAFRSRKGKSSFSLVSSLVKAWESKIPASSVLYVAGTTLR